LKNFYVTANDLKKIEKTKIYREQYLTIGDKTPHLIQKTWRDLSIFHDLSSFQKGTIIQIAATLLI